MCGRAEKKAIKNKSGIDMIYQCSLLKKGSIIVIT